MSTCRSERRRKLANELDDIIETLPEADFENGKPTMNSETERRLEDLGYLQ
jgi:hypothetical protein